MLPVLHQARLADRRGRLKLRHLVRPLLDPEPWQAERDRARRYDRDLDIAPAELDHLVRDRRRPARRGFGDEPAPDLDDHTARGDERLSLGHDGSVLAAMRAR